MDGNQGNFPFYKYINEFNIGDYIPKDQGGKFIQMELLNSEEDETIVNKISNGLLEEIYGNPIGWGKLEKTELEKSVWLNRFYYLPSFARMYYRTGNKMYVGYLMRFISKWNTENPRLAENKQSKYNWYDMQVAWRAIHLSWCYFLAYKGLTEENKTLIFEMQQEHAEVLLSGFGKQALNEFNHQSHGALAMLYLGVLFPALPNARELTNTAMTILNHHINHAFYPDGGNVEQMFGYYPFESHIFRDTLLLCKSNGVPVPENLVPLLTKMTNYMHCVAQPDGTMPPVNDSYAMPVLPALKTINDALEINFSEDKIAPSFYFPDTQIGVLRTNNSDKKLWYILANPASTIGSHAHAGRLAFNLWYGRQPLVIDSGCCNYDDLQLVKWYRTSQAHNTVLIDGRSDEATSKPIQWAAKRRTENRITDWIEKPSYRFCRMVSPASDPTNSSVKWSRSLAIVKDSFVIVYDRFEASEKHDYDVLLHLPSIQLKADQENKCLLFNTDQPVALLPADKNLYREMLIGEGLISVDGVNTTAPVVTYKLSGAALHSVLIFYPVKKSVSEVKVTQEISENGIGLLIEDGKGKKDIVIFRNPEASSVSFMGNSTTDLFAVI